MSADFLQGAMAVDDSTLRRAQSAVGRQPGRGRASVSSLESDLAAARLALKRTPETANPDVERLALQVSDGCYQVPEELVAQKIIEQAMMTRRIGGS
jgi:anti-sigma28 factor (negative regulator of flagellin synthesis)